MVTNLHKLDSSSDNNDRADIKEENSKDRVQEDADQHADESVTDKEEPEEAASQETEADSTPSPPPPGQSCAAGYKIVQFQTQRIALHLACTLLAVYAINFIL